MDKYLMMSAAALFGSIVSTNSVQASTVSFRFYSISGGYSYCDGGTIRNQGVIHAWTHNFTHGCGYTHNTYGSGIAGRSKGFGKNVDLSDTYQPKSGLACNYDFHLPIENFSRFYEYCTSNGVTSFEHNDGVIFKGLAMRRPGTAVSSATAVKDIIAKLNQKS